MSTFMVEYSRLGILVRSRRITKSEAQLMMWVEELQADPNVSEVEVTYQ